MEANISFEAISISLQNTKLVFFAKLKSKTSVNIQPFESKNRLENADYVKFSEQY